MLSDSFDIVSYGTFGLFLVGTTLLLLSNSGVQNLTKNSDFVKFQR